MIPIPLCPHCNQEVEFAISIGHVSIDDHYKGTVMHAIESLMEIQKEVMPFGGKTAIKMTKKMITKYFQRIAAIPVTTLSCKKCNKILSAELFEMTGATGFPR